MLVRTCLIIFVGLVCLISAAPQANNRQKRQRIYFEDELDEIPTPDQGTGSKWDNDDTSRDTRAPQYGPAWNPPTSSHNHFGNWDNAHEFDSGPHKFGWGYDPHDSFHGGSNSYPPSKSRKVPEFGKGPMKEALRREKRQSNRPANNQRPNVSGSWNQNQPSWNEIGNNGNANNGPDWDNVGSWGNNNGGAWNGNQNNGAWNQRPNGNQNGGWNQNPNGNGNQNNGAWNQRPNGNQNNGAWNQRPNGNQNNGAWNQRPNGNQNNGAWNQRPNGNPNGGTGSWNGNQNNGAWNPNPNGSGNPNNGAWNGNPNGGSGNNQRPNGSQSGGTGSWNGGNDGSPNAPGNNGNFGNNIDPTNNRPRPGGSSNNRPRPGGSNNQKIRPPITIGGARPPSTPPPNCDCPATSETNPVCGTDGSTYTNPSRLNCARVCGTSAGVQMQHYGACPATPSPDLRRRG